MMNFIISIISLVIFIYAVYKTHSDKYMFPFVSYRTEEFTIAYLHIISPKNYKYLAEFLIPWLSGMAHLAILGMSGYLVFLANAFD